MRRIPSFRSLQNHASILFAILLPLIAANHLAAQAAPPATPAAPRFVEDSLDKLSCKVRVLSKPEASCLVLRVEVRNRSSHWAEPMIFAVKSTGKAAKKRRGRRRTKVAATPVDELLFRAPQPHSSRFGAGVSPGGKRTYFLQSRSVGSATKFKASVANALFYDGRGLDEPAIKIGRPRYSSFQEFGRRTDITSITVTNKSTLALDLLLIGEFEKPIEGKGLIGVHVDAGEAKTLELRHLPPTLFRGATGVSGVKVSRLKLVDWTTVVDASAADNEKDKRTASRFRKAYEAWARFADDRPELTGQFTYRRLKRKTNKKDKSKSKGIEATGSFKLTPKGSFQIEYGESSAEMQGAQQGQVQLDFMRLFEAATRPNVDLVLKQNDLFRLDRDRVELVGSGLYRQKMSPGNESRLQFRIRDGRINGLHRTRSRETEMWQLKKRSDGWVIVKRSKPGTVAKTELFKHQKVGDLSVPSRLSTTIEVPMQHDLETRDLQLSKLRWSAVAAPAASAAKSPTGDGVAGLEAAWEKPYRYPDKPVTLHARFEMKNPGTDTVWRGQRLVSGKVTLHGFRGFRRRVKSYTRGDVQIDQKLGEPAEDAIESLVLGRLSMWGSREFCGRNRFAEVFRGATIRKDGATGLRFKITDGREFLGVGLRSGMPAWLDRTGGFRTELRYQKVDNHWVVVSVETGKSHVTATWKKIAEGWLLPVEVRLERAMGDDWGPETISLRDVRIE